MKFIPFVMKAQEVGKSPPTEIQIVPLGIHTDSRSGRKFKITEADIEAIVANSKKFVNSRPIDYEHQTLLNTQAPAAGWVSKLVSKGRDGLWATAIEWTAKAKDYLAGREYRYLSPVLLGSKKDADGYYRPVYFHSAALTNTPAIDGMKPLVAKGELFNFLTEGPAMDEQLKKLLGLKAEATDEQVTEAVTALISKAAAAPGGDGDADKNLVIPKEITTALGLKEDASVSEITGTVLAMKQNAEKAPSPDEIKILQDRLDKKDAVEAVALAMKEGKVTADQQDWAEKYATENLEGFQAFVAKAVVIVPVGSAAIKPDEKKGVEMTDAVSLVAKAFGNSDEDVKKYGGLN